MKSLNLALRFLLELFALAALGYWSGTTAYGTPTSVVLAVALPLAAAVFWGTFVSPRARVVLPTSLRMPLGLAVFACAATALADRGHGMLAAIFMGAGVLNVILMLIWRQDHVISPRAA